MPIGLVSDADLEKELDSYKRVPSPAPIIPEIMEIERPGRSDGDNNVPDSLRQIIGETALLEGRQAALQLASQFNISPSSVSAYSNGASSTKTYNEAKPSIIGHINRSRMRVVKRAGKKLNAALEALTQEKLDYADAKDLSGIAKDMSVIIKNMEPPTASSNESETKAPQFVIFAPTFRSESSFEVIDVKE